MSNLRMPLRIKTLDGRLYDTSACVWIIDQYDGICALEATNIPREILDALEFDDETYVQCGNDKVWREASVKPSWIEWRGM